MIFKDLVYGIFYSIIIKHNFELIEFDDKSILYYNSLCYLYISHHMGEEFVFLSKEKDLDPIDPFKWGILTSEFKVEKKDEILFSAEMTLNDILKYNLVKQMVFISLFCEDLLKGDFQKIYLYRKGSK